MLSHYPGSVADMEIFRKNKTFHEEASKECVQDLHFKDEGLLDDHLDDCWAILADKKYQRAADVLLVVHLICGQFIPSRVKHNPKESIGRIVVDISLAV